MIHRRLFVLALMLPGVLPGAASAAPGEGHGSGSGHTFGGYYHRGWYGGFRPGFRGYYGYPGWYGVGLGVGLGLGCACAWGYPYYAYPYAYGYPVYVDVAGVPVAGAVASAPPGSTVQPTSAVARGPAPTAQGSPAVTGPVRLTDTDVLLSIRVPPDAIVQINGTKTTQNGPRREFMSSGLTPGRTYTFSIRAQWTGPDGHAMEREQRLAVQGGERRTIDFLMPAAPSNDVSPASGGGR
jgi:uncharacterized protein (TIGR03000 family)